MVSLLDKAQGKVAQNVLQKIETMHNDFKFHEEMLFLRSLENKPSELKGQLAIAMLFVAVEAKEELKESKLQLFNDALQFTRAYLAEDDENCLAHQLYLMVLSEKGKFEGPRHIAGHLKEIKYHTNRAMELNPKDPINWHIVGSTAFELAALTWLQKQFVKTVYGVSVSGDTIEMAVECFQKADELFEGVDLANKFMLAKCHQVMGDAAEAKRLLQLVGTLQPKTPFDMRYKNEARALLVI